MIIEGSRIAKFALNPRIRDSSTVNDCIVKLRPIFNYCKRISPSIFDQHPVVATYVNLNSIFERFLII
jgi:hypothetical protein